MKFETTIVTGDCPGCEEKTILVNIYKNYFRCWCFIDGQIITPGFKRYDMENYKNS